MNRRIRNGYFIFFIIILLSGCASQRPNQISEEDWTLCHDPRPQICTLEYLPVCARNQAGELRTYATGCTACADSKVTGYRSGSCE